jgi:hypothetical protein
MFSAAVGIGLSVVAIELYRLSLGANVAADARLYHEATLRWLHGSAFYQPYQLAEPYDPLGQGSNAPILYPPVALLLFVPSLLLPLPLWYLIPLGTIATIIVAWRPSLWAWLAIAICMAQFQTTWTIICGTPTIWIVAFVALGTRWPALSALVLLKPSLFPFALFGIRHRPWWLAAGVLAIVSLVLLPMDLDWLRSVLNASGPRSGLSYSLADVPFMAVPLIAWFGRTKVIGAHDPAGGSLDAKKPPPAEASGGERMGCAYVRAWPTKANRWPR